MLTATVTANIQHHRKKVIWFSSTVTFRRCDDGHYLFMTWVFFWPVTINTVHTVQTVDFAFINKLAFTRPKAGRPHNCSWQFPSCHVHAPMSKTKTTYDVSSGTLRSKVWMLRSSQTRFIWYHVFKNLKILDPSPIRICRLSFWVQT